MWRANKRGIIALLVGMALLLGLHFALRGYDVQLARQLLAVGVCALLFVVGLLSWLSVKPPQHEDEEP